LAGPFPQGFIETVRNAGDIVRLISDYVPLKPGGARHKGLCPFHQEKTPSFSVDANRQLFYCFGCQTGGDIFKFVMLYEKVAFPEAVEIVAKRSGVALPKVKSRGPAGPFEKVLQLNDAAAAYFREKLAEGGCRQYLDSRRLDDKTVDRLGIGHAPAGWDGLRGYLLSRRFKIEDALLAGLLSKRKSGSGEYDRFRDRLMFPIRDVQGRTVAFGGRTLGNDDAKYVNSPETLAYKKGEHLYGLDQAKEAIRREGSALVVEGYLDLAAVVQAGFENVVASLGTAFTEAQARLLARYCDRVVFSYDGDAAGTEATARSLDLLLSRGFDVRVLPLPGGCDPDDFIGRNGAEAYGELLGNAPGYLEFLIQREAKRRDLERIEDKVAAVQVVLPHIAKLSNAIERAGWAKRIADALQIDDEWILQEMRSAVRSSREQIRHRPPSTRELPEAEARLVSQLLPAAAQGAIRDEIDLEDLAGTRVLPIVRTIVEMAATGKPVDYTVVLDALDDESDRTLLTAIAFREEPEEGPSVGDCLEALRRGRLRREEKKLAQEIKGSGPAEIDQQLMRLQQLAQQRDAIS